MKKAFLATAAVLASSASAFATGLPGGLTNSTSVPEISALEGTAALAAVAAIVLLAWERRRRAS
jgi:hypothetical protein